MITNMLLISLLGGEGGFRSKLLKAVNSVAATPQKQAFLDNCQAPLTEIQAIEATTGAISKDNLSSFWNAQIKPDGIGQSIIQCASIDIEEGSDLHAQQKDSLDARQLFRG